MHIFKLEMFWSACASLSQNIQHKKIHFFCAANSSPSLLCTDSERSFPACLTVTGCWSTLSALPARIRNTVRELFLFHLLKYDVCGVSNVVNDHSDITKLLPVWVLYQHFIYPLLSVVLFWCTVTLCQCNLCISPLNYLQKGPISFPAFYSSMFSPGFIDPPDASVAVHGAISAEHSSFPLFLQWV